MRAMRIIGMVPMMGIMPEGQLSVTECPKFFAEQIKRHYPPVQGSTVNAVRVHQLGCTITTVVIEFEDEDKAQSDYVDTVRSDVRAALRHWDADSEIAMVNAGVKPVQLGVVVEGDEGSELILPGELFIDPMTEAEIMESQLISYGGY